MEAASEDTVLEPATPRLAEMVMHLSGCTPEQAVRLVEAAVKQSPDAAGDDPLQIVAQALVALRSVDLREALDIREPPSRAERTNPVA